MKHFSCFLFLLLTTFCSSCVKEDDYLKYLEDGELMYPARPDSIGTHPGRDRIMLSWLLTGDPNLIRYQIFWNQGAESITVPVSGRSGGTDTISVLIDNQVPEGTYTFTIYSFDEAGHRSNPSELTAKTYGDNYQNQLPGNRKIAKIEHSSDSLFITWEGAPPDNVFTELHYVSVDETEKTIRVARDSSATVVPDYKFSSDILYQSGFAPDSNAIDIFYIPGYDTTRFVK